ncbi:hypothetical protein Tco_1288136 [Tanacetum coccineum]
MSWYCTRGDITWLSTDDEEKGNKDDDKDNDDRKKNVAEKLEEEKVGIIKDHADIEINSLFDVQIQQEIPPVLSASLLDVLVSVIPPSTSITTIPISLPTPPITITTQPVTSSLPATEAPNDPGP